jgi:enolase
MNKKNKIISVSASEMISDRNKPAVQVVVETEGGIVGKAMCSPGISVGKHEAKFVYDGGQKWKGLGVSQAVDNVNHEIAPLLIGMDVTNQTLCDSAILTKDKVKMGANATAAVSTAILNTGATALNMPLYEHIGGVRAFTLPVPGVTAATGSTRYGGNIYAGYKPSFSFVSYDFDTFTEATTALWEVFMNWSDFIKEKLGIKMQIIAGMAIAQGKLKNDFELLDYMTEVINETGFKDRIGIQIDIAANSFYNKESKLYEGIFSKEPKTRDDMIELMVKIAKEYPIVNIEDPLHDDDFEGFAEITKQVDIQITGDDLLATNPERVKNAIQMGAGNAMRVVTSQIGTVSEAAEIALYAKENNFGISPCGERGEGNAICDYIVGYNAGMAREYGLGYSGNRLLKIEHELGPRARFFGKRGINGKRFQL